jgi:NAD(P)-dependent dehydrogenase (short-subunit alcohol dehydrogenase family)
MLAVTGYNSRIVQELRTLLPEGEEVVALASRGRAIATVESDRFLLCAGVIRPAKLVDQTDEDVAETLDVNCIAPIRFCEWVLERFETARICVIGSESAFTWSFDDAYAASKVALHRYVETRKLGPKQQLICIAPSIIGDCNMTTGREDHENLARRKEEHPKKRFLRAAEVAKLVHFLLYVDEGYLSGQVIRMNGGC